MKKIILILFLLLFFLPLTVSAHKGRTDSNGGHYDRSTGEYHYHHGYPAHQHENGICPYDYDVKTKKNKNNSSSNSKDNKSKNYKKSQKATTKSEIYYNNSYDDEDYESNEEPRNPALWIFVVYAPLITLFLGWFVYGLISEILESLKYKLFKKFANGIDNPTIIIGIFCFIITWAVSAFLSLKYYSYALISLVSFLLILLVIWYFICKHRNKKEEIKYIEEQKQRDFEQKELQRKRDLKLKLLKKREILKYLFYINKSKSELFNLVNNTNVDIEFDNNNLPIPNYPKIGKYGEYTVFITQRGKKIHRKPFCCNATIEKFDFATQGNYCKICANKGKPKKITKQEYIRFLNIYYYLNKNDLLVDKQSLSESDKTKGLKIAEQIKNEFINIYNKHIENKFNCSNEHIAFILVCYEIMYFWANDFTVGTASAVISNLNETTNLKKYNRFCVKCYNKLIDIVLSYPNYNKMTSEQLAVILSETTKQFFEKQNIKLDLKFEYITYIKRLK